MNGQETELEPRLLEACIRAGQINEDQSLQAACGQPGYGIREKIWLRLHGDFVGIQKKGAAFFLRCPAALSGPDGAGGTESADGVSCAGSLRTSGTEGGSKRIPVTFASLERYSDQIEWVLKIWRTKRRAGKRLSVNGFRVGLMQEKKEYLLSELYYQYLFRNGFLSFEDFAGGEETMFGQNGRDILYAKVWTAFAVEEITSIESIFLYDQLLFFRYLERHWRSILKKYAKKADPGGDRPSERTKAKLLKCPYAKNGCGAWKKSAKRDGKGSPKGSGRALRSQAASAESPLRRRTAACADSSGKRRSTIFPMWPPNATWEWQSGRRNAAM